MTYLTPDYSHVSNYVDVYVPSEDTFLMLDALEQDHKFLKDTRPKVCVEVGCGSGVISAFLSTILGRNVFYMATDINPSAVMCTRETATRNKSLINVINTNLLVGCKMFKKVDVLVFNPPYVVTSSDEVTMSGITASWAGGKSGREVMDKLFPIVPHILSDNGVFYLLVLEENQPDEIVKVMNSYNLKTEVILNRKARNEKLYILKIQRNIWLDNCN